MVAGNPVNTLTLVTHIRVNRVRLNTYWIMSPWRMNHLPGGGICVPALPKVLTRDILGWGMLWMLGGIMLKFAQDVLNVTGHVNGAYPVFVIPFQSYAGVHRRRPVSC
jgi:hypothetical protein